MTEILVDFGPVSNIVTNILTDFFRHNTCGGRFLWNRMRLRRTILTNFVKILMDFCQNFRHNCSQQFEIHDPYLEHIMCVQYKLYVSYGENALNNIRKCSIV